MDSRDFLGRGWSFPIAVDPRTGRIAMVSHEEDIRQSVGLILRTYRYNIVSTKIMQKKR